MTFDCSRFSFNSWNDYLGVGDAAGPGPADFDWNEWLSELARRMQAGTMDTVGRAVYPTTTPFGFKINAFLDNSGTQHVSIGAGRMYVDGLSAENHGPAAAAPWDPSLAELSWTAPGAAEVDVDFTAQPYYPGAALPSGNGPYLAYLDVWRRPVSFLIDPSLVETAVAVDTTGRLQTVWQVRLLDVSSVSGGVICSTPDADIPPWQALVAPSAARLTTNVVPSPQAAPCAISPTTGYTGQENQLYRVQIHQGGTANASGGVANPSATFKWSRDNASVITAVTAINPATSSAQASTSQLTVQSTGRDQTLSFQPGDWIEITDDVMELDGAATGGPTGELHQIDTNGVVKAARTITLVTPVSAGLATRLAGPVNTHTRICRWDMNAGNGKVLLSDGATLWVDLSLVGTGSPRAAAGHGAHSRKRRDGRVRPQSHDRVVSCPRFLDLSGAHRERLGRTADRGAADGRPSSLRAPLGGDVPDHGARLPPPLAAVGLRYRMLLPGHGVAQRHHGHELAAERAGQVSQPDQRDGHLPQAGDLSARRAAAADFGARQHNPHRLPAGNRGSERGRRTGERFRRRPHRARQHFEHDAARIAARHPAGSIQPGERAVRQSGRDLVRSGSPNPRSMTSSSPSGCGRSTARA